ncbi:unnamed protein product [Linum tenue]|uniref:Uncharacterized protein n=1 Tax=Linum tenue TaxID=586396 RepID=A0AAV0LQC5_9ROSI|nr:unnamed protein product [Linum tenue]
MAVPSLSSIFRGGHHRPAAENNHHPPAAAPPSNYVCEGDVCYLRKESQGSSQSQSRKSSAGKGKPPKEPAVVCFSMFPRRIRLGKAPAL